MAKLRTIWNRFSIFSFNLIFYDGLSMLGSVLLFCAIGFTLFSAQNINRPGVVALWLSAAVVLSASGRRKNLRRKLRENGVKIEGEVTKIKRSMAKTHTSTMHFADEDAVHPFSIEYRYRFNGKEYTGASEYFWAQPCVEPGSAVTLFVDEKCPERSAFDDSNIKLI